MSASPFPLAVVSPRNILGVLVHPTTYARAVQDIVDAAKARQSFAVSALAVHGVMTGALDPMHRMRLNQFDLVTPDGQPVRWALNWLHDCRLTDRVYGPFLTRDLCARAASENLSVFFYGSDDATLTALSTALLQKHPTLRIAGTRPSRFRRATEAEWKEDVAAIRSCDPDLIFCGLGCPRQEIWVHEMKAFQAMPLIAVGAAFPFLAGRLAMAPAWMQRLGLEWLYRLSREPRRLFRRYAVYNPLFVGGVVAQKLRLQFYPPDAVGPTPVAERWS